MRLCKSLENGCTRRFAYLRPSRIPTTLHDLALLRPSEPNPLPKWVLAAADLLQHGPSNGWRLSGDGGEADRVRCRRGLGDRLRSLRCESPAARMSGDMLNSLRLRRRGLDQT